MKLSFGLYSKSALFWLVVFLTFLSGGYLLRSGRQRITAIDKTPQASQPGVFAGEVVIGKDGSVTFQGKDVSKSLSRRGAQDEFQLKVLDEPGFSFDQASITVTLPFALTEGSLKTEAFLIHSLDNTVAVTKQPPNRVEFSARNVSQDAVFTIRLIFAKGLIDYPAGREISNFFLNAPLGFWIVLALILPMATLLYMVVLVVAALSQAKPATDFKPTDIPPADLSPAMVGLIKRGTVGAREVAATLVDLGRRGFIDIFWKEKGFTFGKRKPFHFYTLAEAIALPIEGLAKTAGLRRYEEVLLSKILPPEGYRSTAEDITVRIGHRLFSPKMAAVFMEIYQLATKAGYFVANPGLVHRRVRRRGIALFIAGLIGFALSALFLSEPKFLLIFWIGTIAAALLIVELANFIPLRTPSGQKMLQDWLAFERYLADPSPISYSQAAAGVFERYLPYAIALGVEGVWVARFRNHPFTSPGWFGSTTDNLTLEQFDRELFPILGWVASSLVTAKEPTVE